MLPRLSTWVIAALAGGALVSGCGGGSESAPHDASTRPSSTPNRGSSYEEHDPAVHGDAARHGSGEPVDDPLHRQHAPAGPCGPIGDRDDGDENRAQGHPAARENLWHAGRIRLQGRRSCAADAQREHQGET